MKVSLIGKKGIHTSDPDFSPTTYDPNFQKVSLIH
jgi:hypothetical protein